MPRLNFCANFPKKKFFFLGLRHSMADHRKTALQGRLVLNHEHTPLTFIYYLKSSLGITIQNMTQEETIKPPFADRLLKKNGSKGNDMLYKTTLS